jgi:thioredoxin 1
VVRPLPRRAAADRERLRRAIPGVRHVKVEDGSGRRLGRSFGVKLWPTLVFLRDGTERARAVRPRDLAAIEAGFAEIDAGGAEGAAP